MSTQPRPLRLYAKQAWPGCSRNVRKNQIKMRKPSDGQFRGFSWRLAPHVPASPRPGIPPMKFSLVSWNSHDTSLTCAKLINHFPPRSQPRRVSPSGYYAWKNRVSSRRKVNDAALISLIHEIYHASWRRYVVPRVHTELLDQGFAESQKRVAHFMPFQGLL